MNRFGAHNLVELIESGRDLTNEPFLFLPELDAVALDLGARRAPSTLPPEHALFYLLLLLLREREQTRNQLHW